MFNDDKGFENEVRRIARLRWPSADIGGATIEGGRERDGIFITEEMVHLIECTTSRSKKKAEEDIKKLVELLHQMQRKYPSKGIKGYFITMHEPTADQKAVASKHTGIVVAESFEEFKRPLIDAHSYLACRQNYPFGSMRDPETNSSSKDIVYIEPDLLDTTGKLWRIAELVKTVQDRHGFVITGDYGVGKSTTMRKIFSELAKEYRKKKSPQFPVFLNLRDHHGQTEVSEALERHARNIGYHAPHHLVRAWLAGEVILLLDGFDEVAIAGWSGNAEKLKNLRYRSMELLRRFIKNVPDTAAVIVSGRTNYFDSRSELTKALGIDDRFTMIALQDFSEEQVQQYLRKNSWTGSIPSWLPSRPLLLGYLAAKRLLPVVALVASNVSPAEGWHHLLDKICEREADQIDAGLDRDTIRELLERLATRARRSPDGLGPLQDQEIIDTFVKVVGSPPDDRSIVLLQRLPGLGPNKQEDGWRDFIDKDLVDAARSGDVYRFLVDPYNFEPDMLSEWQTTIDHLGRQIVMYRLMDIGYKYPQLSIAAQRAAKNKDMGTLSGDVLLVMLEFGVCYTGEQILIKDVEFLDATFGDENLDYSKIKFSNCWFRRLELGVGATPGLLPKFHGCLIGVLEGRVSRKDLPEGVFDADCDIEVFGETTYNPNAILDMSRLSLGERVLLTVLRKLYLQPGSGRLESAFYRGLDQRARAIVPDVLKLVRQEGLVEEVTVGTRSYWLPIRAETTRVRRIINAPHQENDALLLNASQL